MQKIIIHNFRQITHAEIDIKKILLLIGEQASGKSTIAKLIYFFKSLKEDYFNLVYENIENSQSDDLQTLFIAKIEDKFKQYFGSIKELPADFEITYCYNFDLAEHNEHKSIKIYKTTSLQVEFNAGYFKKQLNQVKENALQIAFFFNQQMETKDTNTYNLLEIRKANSIQRLNDYLSQIFKDNGNHIFFPAGRNITVSYPEQFQSLFLGNISHHEESKSMDMLLMKSFILHAKFLYDYFRGKNFVQLIENETVSSFLQNKLEYILKGRYDNSDGDEKIIFGKKNKQSVSINMASSGQQEVIRIIQDLWYIVAENQSSFRIIEEPEAHLYPKAQKNLIEMLMFVINKTNSQLILTTHSPYMLSILNNLLMYNVVAQNNPQATDKIKAHFGTSDLNGTDERIHILPNEMEAYSLNVENDEYCKSLIDKETGLIGENFLDTVTEELNSDFDVLYTLNFQAV